jgi:hypothetical protein
MKQISLRVLHTTVSLQIKYIFWECIGIHVMSPRLGHCHILKKLENLKIRDLKMADWGQIQEMSQGNANMTREIHTYLVMEVSRMWGTRW